MKDQQEQHQQTTHRNRHENSHRHNNDHRRNHSSDTTKRIGQFFGLIYNISLIYFVCDLAKNGDQKLALTLFLTNALLIIAAIFFVKKPSKHRQERYSKNFRPRNRERGARDRVNPSSE